MYDLRDFMNTDEILEKLPDMFTDEFIDEDYPLPLLVPFKDK